MQCSGGEGLAISMPYHFRHTNHSSVKTLSVLPPSLQREGFNEVQNAKKAARRVSPRGFRFVAIKFFFSASI